MFFLIACDVPKPKILIYQHQWNNLGEIYEKACNGLKKADQKQLCVVTCKEKELTDAQLKYGIQTLYRAKKTFGIFSHTDWEDPLAWLNGRRRSVCDMLNMRNRNDCFMRRDLDWFGNDPRTDTIIATPELLSKLQFFARGRYTSLLVNRMNCWNECVTKNTHEKKYETYFDKHFKNMYCGNKQLAQEAKRRFLEACNAGNTSKAEIQAALFADPYIDEMILLCYLKKHPSYAMRLRAQLYETREQNAAEISYRLMRQMWNGPI